MWKGKKKINFSPQLALGHDVFSQQKKPKI